LDDLRMNQLLPAILVQDEATFRERLSLVQDLVPVVHLDVMDGAFVPNRTWFDAKVLETLETPVRFELHLMVMDPGRVVDEVRNIEKVFRTIWHMETEIDHAALIERVHAMQKEAGLAIKPQTALDELARYADGLDEILVMGAEPGFSGRALDPHTIERATEIHERFPEMAIGFDIGVNAETIPRLKAAGVSRFCAASAIFTSADPREELRRLVAML
jgi:ribulose-phosphate 3-epimerase